MSDDPMTSGRAFTEWWNGQGALELDGDFHANYKEARAEALAAWTHQQSEIDRLTRALADLQELFKCTICGCGSPRRSCNAGLRHIIKGGVCTTCEGTPAAADVGGKRDVCPREIADHLVHAEFELDCRTLEIAKLEAQIDPELIAWFKSLDDGKRAEMRHFFLRDLDQRREVDRLTRALTEATRERDEARRALRQVANGASARNHDHALCHSIALSALTTTEEKA